MQPEQVKIAITFADGSLGVMAFVTRGFTPTGELQFEREPTPDNVEMILSRYANRWATSDPHLVPVLSWSIVSDESGLRDDDVYRDAWRFDGVGIFHDMPRAREIHRGRIRAQRVPLLEEQDRALMLVDEDETLTAPVRLQRRRGIIAKKKALRDAPSDPRIETAQTIDELRSIDPLTGL